MGFIAQPYSENSCVMSSMTLMSQGVLSSVLEFKFVAGATCYKMKKDVSIYPSGWV